MTSKHMKRCLTIYVIRYVSQLFITVSKIPNNNNLEEERFILAPGIRGSVHGGLTLFLFAQNRQNMTNKGQREGALHSWQPGSRDRELEEGAIGKINSSGACSQ